MSKEELKELLKENLTIYIDEYNEYASKGYNVTVYFDGEEIATSSVETGYGYGCGEDA